MEHAEGEGDNCFTSSESSNSEETLMKQKRIF